MMAGVEHPPTGETDGGDGPAAGGGGSRCILVLENLKDMIALELELEVVRVSVGTSPFI